MSTRRGDDAHSLLAASPDQGDAGGDRPGDGDPPDGSDGQGNEPDGGEAGRPAGGRARKARAGARARDKDREATNPPPAKRAPAAQAAPAQAAPAKAAAAQAEPGQAAPAKVTPGQPTPGEAMPASAAPGQASPGQAAPAQTSARQAAPGQATGDAPALTREHRVARLCPATRLATASGESAQRYRAAVGKFLGTSIKTETFHVDRRGFSPEVAAELGARYLDAGDATRVVIALEQQASCGLIDPPASYLDDLLTEAFASKTVAQLTLRHVLVGVARADRPEGGFPHVRASLSLDTPDEDLTELAGLRESLDRLAQEPDQLLDAPFVRELVAKARALSASLGELGTFGPHGPIAFCRPVGSSWDRSRAGLTVLGPEPWLVVFNPALEAAALQLAPDVSLVGTDDPALPAKLIGAGYAALDERMIPVRIALLEERALLAAGIDPRPLDPQRRHTEAILRREALPALYHALRDASLAERGRRAALVATLPPAARVALLVPRRDHSVMGRLLAQLDESDPAMLWRYRPDRFGEWLRSANTLEADWALDRVEAVQSHGASAHDLVGVVPVGDQDAQSGRGEGDEPEDGADGGAGDDGIRFL